MHRNWIVFSSKHKKEGRKEKAEEEEEEEEENSKTPETKRLNKGNPTERLTISVPPIAVSALHNIR